MVVSFVYSSISIAPCGNHKADKLKGEVPGRGSKSTWVSAARCLRAGGGVNRTRNSEAKVVLLATRDLFLCTSEASRRIPLGMRDQDGNFYAYLSPNCPGWASRQGACSRRTCCRD